ncbi:MAG TPA: hypothetical protein VEK07_11625 [Polyangiaceae bacterium]|nr:hypothetical protein [Polyangiaceae bacterium]
MVTHACWPNAAAPPCRVSRAAGVALALLGSAVPTTGRATSSALTSDPAANGPTAPEPPPADAPSNVQRASAVAADAPAPATTPALRPRPRGSPVIGEAIAGVVGSVGVAPAPAIGAAIGGGVRWRDASLALEGRFDAAASAPVEGGGGVSSSLALVSLAPCGYVGPLLGCALVQGGQIRASAEAPSLAQKSAPWWAAGGRVGTQVPLGSDRTVVRLRSDLLVNLVPQSFELAGTQPWKVPRVAGSLGLDIILQFR